MEKREPDYRDTNKMVVHNSYITAIHPDKMSINAMKLFRLVITQCRLKDEKFYVYDFKITDLAKLIDIDSSNLYKDTQAMCISLMQMLLKAGSENPKESWKLKHIFDRCEYEAETGTITIKLHEDMTDLFLQLQKDFTRIPIFAILTMKSKHAIRLYELICKKMMSRFPYANMSTSISITLEEIKEVTGTKNKKSYEEVGHLKAKVITPAINEIEHCTNWKIILSDIKKGRRITGFNMEVWSKQGYDYIEYCKKTGTLPENEIPGQLNIFDVT